MEEVQWGKKTTTQKLVTKGLVKRKASSERVEIEVEGVKDNFGLRYCFRAYMAGGLSVKSLYVYRDYEEAKVDAVTMAHHMLDLGVPSMITGSKKA